MSFREHEDVSRLNVNKPKTILIIIKLLDG